jgi:hypothetical protein
VPDFKSLHAKWEAAQAAKKEACGRRLTVPEVSVPWPAAVCAW